MGNALELFLALVPVDRSLLANSLHDDILVLGWDGDNEAWDFVDLDLGDWLGDGHAGVGGLLGALPNSVDELVTVGLVPLSTVLMDPSPSSSASSAPCPSSADPVLLIVLGGDSWVVGDLVGSGSDVEGGDSPSAALLGFLKVSQSDSLVVGGLLSGLTFLKSQSFTSLLLNPLFVSSPLLSSDELVTSLLFHHLLVADISLDLLLCLSVGLVDSLSSSCIKSSHIFQVGGVLSLLSLTSQVVLMVDLSLTLLGSGLVSSVLLLIVATDSLLLLSVMCRISVSLFLNPSLMSLLSSDLGLVSSMLSLLSSEIGLVSSMLSLLLLSGTLSSLLSGMVSSLLLSGTLSGLAVVWHLDWLALLQLSSS